MKELGVQFSSWLSPLFSFSGGSLSMGIPDMETVAVLMGKRKKEKKKHKTNPKQKTAMGETDPKHLQYCQKKQASRGKTMHSLPADRWVTTQNALLKTSFPKQQNYYSFYLTSHLRYVYFLL